MSHPLDRVIWTALAGRQSVHAEGDDLARRYAPAILPFGAARDHTPDALSALAGLVRPGEAVVQVEAAPALPPGLVAVRTGTVLQMVLTRPLPADAALPIATLGPEDAEDMLALARLTEPGPFTLGAQQLGRFCGVRVDGRLAAMAGERFRVAGHSEVSGVCTHPDFRGRGFARALSIAVAQQILARGETPFLHSWTENATAIRLYDSIGFAVRGQFTVLTAARPA